MSAMTIQRDPVPVIRTPDQRVRVFVSSTLKELAVERAAAQDAIESIKLTPVLFELGARPHAPQALYRSYLDQSDIFVGIYDQSYGWVAPEMDISGLEDEYRLAGSKPKLIYVKRAAERDPKLNELLDRIKRDDVSYTYFEDAEKLRDLVVNDLALLLTETFTGVEAVAVDDGSAPVANLPVPVNVFVGREREMARLRSMLDDEGARLITLVGPGGIGKTRLALEFARSVQDRFPDGTFLVSLQALQDPHLVGAAIARALGVLDVPGTPIEDVVAEELGGKRTLLIIDNFEQVIDSAPVVADLVAASPGVVAIVTSRAPLNVRAEHELLLPPLDAPGDGDMNELRHVDQYAAVRLFIDRAQAANGSFHVTDANAPAVAEITHRLDGIPLAIELAAARVRMLTPDAMLDRMGDRFSLLRGGARDLPERHQTLRSTIDWSYNLLSEGEKLFFRNLGVFNGGWTLEAAEAVCDPDGNLDVLELTAALVEQSLIFTRESRDEPRFSMLETIRQYARDRAEEEGELRALRDRRSDHFLSVIAAARSRLRSGDQQRTLNQLEDDSGNLRSVLKWCVVSGRAGDAADASWVLWHYWWLRDRFEEGMLTTESILASDELSDLQRARAMASRGAIAFWRGDYAETLTLVTSALDAFWRLGDDDGIALAQLPLAIVSAVLVGPDEALPRFEESRRLYETLGDPWGALLAMNAMNWMRVGMRLEITDVSFEETLGNARKLGTDIEIAMASGNLGALRVIEGRLDEARPLLLISLDILSKYRIRNMATFSLEQTAELAMAEEDAATAGLLLGAAEAIRLKIGAPLSPVQAMYREQTLQKGAELIGTSQLETVLAAGAQLSFEAAIAEAKAKCLAG